MQHSPGAANTTPAQRWTFLAVISTGLFLIGMDNSVLFTALPQLEEQLHTTERQALWIINAYPLVLSGLLLGTGTLGDRIGHRRMFLVGLSIFVLGSLTAAFSPTAIALIAARALLGLGGATMMPATLALIRVTFRNERELSTAIGIWGSVAVVGAASGPVIGGALLEAFWWGSVFLINVPVGLIALVAALILAPPNQPNPAAHWDWLSSLLALLTVSGLVMSIKEAAHSPRQWGLLAVSLLVVVVAGACFTLRQRRLAVPLLDAAIFRNRMFSGGVLAAAGAMFAMSGLELTTTQRFQLALGYSPLHAGLVVALAAVAAMPLSILGGAYLHRLGFRTLITGGFGLISGAVLVSAVGLWADSMPIFLLGIALAGAGMGAAMSVSSTAIIGSAPRERAGMASSVEEVSYEFGSLLSVAILGSLLPTFLKAFTEGGATYEDAFDSSYLVILCIIAVVGAVFAAITAWCFQGNPRRTPFGEGH
ncbi:MFS transporter [Corynebacterium lowii]|uniref:Antiseptic resistance protein n=1 Tax=Corynebacterium lowii TaxID=1544413 RepID=A0A0Q1DV34_9CORY|nr:MFS transporter [Corynebacterium lowii]KQB84011.1 Antiseptic resistance protein [Corynebacterium lowii]MDP9852739.1 DHA2 family multidrug resistance protein-like MFS transporter [Corynebacterium lowii]